MFSAHKRKPKLHVFFSHSKQDARVVKRLARKISRWGGSAWAYEHSLPFGERIGTSVHKEIYECDFFIIVASPAGLSSEWVARETWLAEYYRKQRGINHNPRVLVYVPRRASRRVAGRMQLPLRDFETGKLTGEVRDLGVERAFVVDNRDTDAFTDLCKVLSPSIKLFGRDYESGEEFLSSGISDTYERLFPEDEEREELDDIIDWLGEGPGYLRVTLADRFVSVVSRIMGKPMVRGSTWGEWFATFDVGGRAVGLVYLTVHKPTGWVFGNYFGLLESWRPHQRAQWFLDEMVNELRQAAPHVKGIVFEVHPFAGDPVRSLSRKLKSGPLASEMAAKERTHFLEDEEVKIIKSIRRIRLYVRHGAKVVLGGSGEPLWYRQPAMKVPSSNESWEDLESALWLMVYPIGSKKWKADVTELLDFIYFDFFREAYEPIFAEKGVEYMPYLKKLRDRAIADARPGSIVLGEGYSKEDTRIVGLAQRKGFNVDL